MVELVHALGVEELGALLLPQPDGDHLHQTRLDRSAEIGVRFDPADRDDGVGLEGVAVEPDRNVVLDLAEVDRIHTGTDRAAHRRFGDAVVAISSG